MNKFRNVKHGGFDSKKEARRWSELLVLYEAGKIRDLQNQRVFQLIPRQMDGKRVAERAITYRSDFDYIECATGELVVEDVKGEYTRKLPVYKIKKKLMRYVHGIVVKEV